MGVIRHLLEKKRSRHVTTEPEIGGGKRAAKVKDAPIKMQDL